MQGSAQSPWRDRELLEYRRERIELLLSEEIISPEMEAQLRETLAAIDREIDAYKALQFAPAQRQAA